MASVYKRTRQRPIPQGAELSTRDGKRYATWIDAKTGRKRRAPLNDAGDKLVIESGNYLIAYDTAGGERKIVNSKTPDKDAAQQLANKLETETMLRARGIIDAAQERHATHAQRPIAEHVADFAANLAARQNTAKHVRTTRGHVETILKLCNAERLADVTGAAVMQALDKLRLVGSDPRPASVDGKPANPKQGASLRTCNAYLRSIKSFTRWLWRERRTPDDALVALESFNEQTDRRHVRRELTPEETAWLLKTTEALTRPEHNLAGPDRAMVYRLALGTGFRANELRSLTPESFDLEGDAPTVSIAAGYSKRRRQDVQPIRADLAALLRPWLAAKPPRQRLFGKLPGNTARMLRGDLDAARAAWIDASRTDEAKAERERSDFLRHENADGEVVDFHSTRHTYISGIVAGGASVKTAQELARHSSPNLTIGRYSHTRLHDVQGALDALPPVATTPAAPEALPLRATGTEPAGVSGRESIGAANGQRASGEVGRIVANVGERGERVGQPDESRKRLRIADLGHDSRAKKKEALVGVEPTMADLQSAALATWLQRLKLCYWRAYAVGSNGQVEK
jgi:integrase